ncbi:MAG: uracil-DNA glycosylase [Chloroflexi bacterium]|nr:uracil-DNA glycosylase [Chloroflexota bacterium]
MSDFDDLITRIKTCTLCSLSEKRTQAVPGEGSLDADIMFIGEGPGFYEDRDGRPFIGPAGKFLDELLASAGLRRESVYITNMVKCRPPNNRDPLPGEVDACRPHLNSQIDMISPRVIVTLGRHSFSKFFPSQSLTKERGQPRRWRNLTVYPMYHPAAALHNPRLRPVIVEDFSRLPSLVEAARQMPQEQEVAPIRQLSLFE